MTRWNNPAEWNNIAFDFRFCVLPHKFSVEDVYQRKVCLSLIFREFGHFNVLSGRVVRSSIGKLPQIHPIVPKCSCNDLVNRGWFCWKSQPQQELDKRTSMLSCCQSGCLLWEVCGKAWLKTLMWLKLSQDPAPQIKKVSQSSTSSPASFFYRCRSSVWRGNFVFCGSCSTVC